MDATAVRPAVEERGELSLSLAGMTMVLRPSYEAITAYENDLGRGSVSLANEALAKRLKLGEVAQIATHCIRAFGDETGSKDMARATPQRIAKLILDSDGGIIEATGTLAAMLSLVVTGGYDSAGNPKASTMTTMKTETMEEAPVDA